jgi:hypothetical protein
MKRIFPKKYQFVHEYSFFLHDILVSIIKEGEPSKLFEVKRTFKDDAEANNWNSQKLKGKEFWFWLRENGYEDILREYSQKQVFIATLSDFCHYIYTSLKSSEKGKLSVAYELIRKPLKENLLFLEWLLADPEEFSDNFNEGKVLDLAVSKISKEKKIKIISDALKNSKYPSWISAEFIYELRYSKKVDFGFEKLWNRATHLITNFEDFKTENENLNFVFSDDDAKESLWTQYYKILPFLLFHTVQVTLGYISKIGELPILDDFLLEARKMIGFTLVLNKDSKSDVILKAAKEMLKEFDLHCPLCKQKVKLNKYNLINFYKDSLLECRICHTVFQLNYNRTV